MTESKQIAPVPSVFRESIKSAAQSLGAAENSQPTTQAPPPYPLSPKVEAPVADTTPAESHETPEIVAEVPAIVAETKSENKRVEAATESISGEGKTVVNNIQEFEFDEDTRSYLTAIYKEAEVTEEKKTPSKQKEDLEERYKPYVEKATEYESIINDPLTKAFIEFRKSGGSDPSEFVQQAGVFDVEKMTPEQLIEIDMKNTGLTPDQITEEMERFNDLSVYEKKKLTKSVKEDLLRQRDEKLKAFTGKSEQSQVVFQEAVKRGTQELDSVIQNMENKRYKGLLITPEMAKSIRQDVLNNSVPRLDDKGQFVGFDIAESVRRSVILNYDEIRSKALIELGKTLGADRAMTARIRPNKKEVGAAVVPITQNGLDEAAKNVADKFWKKRGVKTK